MCIAFYALFMKVGAIQDLTSVRIIADRVRSNAKGSTLMNAVG